MQCQSICISEHYVVELSWPKVELLRICRGDEQHALMSMHIFVCCKVVTTSSQVVLFERHPTTNTLFIPHHHDHDTSFKVVNYQKDAAPSQFLFFLSLVLCLCEAKCGNSTVALHCA